MPSVSVTGAQSYLLVDYDTESYAALATSLLGVAPPTMVTTSGSLVIPADGSPVTVFGTTGGDGIGDVAVADSSALTNQLFLTGNGTNLNLTAAAGGGTIVAGNGANVLNLDGRTGPGSWDVLLGSGGNVVNGDGGSGDGWVALGGADTVTAGPGNEVVFGAATGGAQVYSGSPTIPASAGSTLTYAGGAGAATVYGGAGTLHGFGGAGNVTYNITLTPAEGVTPGSQTAAVLVGGTGTTAVDGVTGLVQYFGTNGSSVSFSGATSNNLFVAGSGNETLNAAGATGANVLYAGSGDDQLMGGSGDDILFGGSGNATLAGGGGNDVFAFVNQAGGSASMDTISDFTSGDSLALGGGVSIADQDLSGGNLVVTLSDETRITFVGLNYDIPTGSVTHF